MKIGQEQQILVEVGDYEFCIDLDEVLSIANPPPMVRLPSARGAFVRAFKYQDELGAAVSMRVKFDLPERQDMKSGQMLMGRLNGRLAGFWFDKVSQILKIGDGAEWYPIPKDLEVPGQEFDGFILYQDRLIPHTSLPGLLAFEQAQAWRQFVDVDKRRLEEKLIRAAKAASAAAEAEAARRVEISLPGPDELIPLEELYALMDEAGVHVESDVTADQDTEVVEAESGQAGSSEEPVAEPEEEPLPLAVPVGLDIETEESVAATNQLTVGESTSVDEPSEPAEQDVSPPSGEDTDAMFSLERKRDDIRKRMDPDGDANLGDYSIIKVDDKSLFGRLRRWLRRLILVVLLLALVAAGTTLVAYQGERQLPLDELWVHKADGSTDWAASGKSLSREWGRFLHYLEKQLEALRHP